MRIIVFVFFNFKCPVFFFKSYADVNINIGIIGVVFIIFHIPAAKLAYTVNKFSFFIYQG